MPVGIAATKIATTNVMISFFIFAILFTVLLIAEIKNYDKTDKNWSKWRSLIWDLKT